MPHAGASEGLLDCNYQGSPRPRQIGPSDRCTESKLEVLELMVAGTVDEWWHLPRHLSLPWGSPVDSTDGGAIVNGG